MSTDKLPLEILKEKYIPVENIASEYNITVEEIMDIIKRNKIRYAEFKAPDAVRRTPHVNPEDILKFIEDRKVIN